MLSVLFVINILIALVIIFLERKDSSATLAWIMLLFLLPGIGLLLYMAFSQNIARKKIFKLFDNEEIIMTMPSVNQKQALEEGDFQFINDTGKKWESLIKLNNSYAYSYYSENNKADIYTDGKKKLRSLFEDIEKAKESIHIQYFIVKKDIVGDALLKKLIRKANQGVEVRLLVDALGSWRINKELVEQLKFFGGKYAEFFPTKWKFFNSKINYRNHRKIAVIDNKVAYIGGFNIAKEYIGKKKKFGYWRDTHLRLKGDSVQDINARFLIDWRYASDEELSVEEVFFDEEVGQGDVGIQVLSSGPNDYKEEIKMALLKMISSAKKNIYIQTPYFIPDETILESLKMAIQSGVEVKLMIPSIPDHMFVYWATYSFVGELIKVGGKVYIYNKGFLHAKTMTVDGEVSTVGSTNFDRRSFRLNFEANALIYDRETTEKLEEIFAQDIKESSLLTEEIYEKRGRIIQIKEAISRILSDVL